MRADPRPRFRLSVRLPVWAGLTLLLAAALGLRSLRLGWQPLWWDEGYSVFFATEALSHMAELTARDIHPPLYYALLHLWTGLWGSADPTVLRALSVLIGGVSVPVIWWVGRVLFPARPRIALIAALLLAVNPMHLFYSQEVRMYGLELLLGLLSTGWFWRLWTAQTLPHRRRAALVYGLITAAALYTEYYVALLPLAHFLWAVWQSRRHPQTLMPLLAADMLAALLYLPWLLFTVPHLLSYIQAKVVADNDAPLNLLAYAGRHLLAFSAGHIPLPTADWLRFCGPAGLLLLLLLARTKSRAQTPVPVFLAWGLLFPAALGYTLNRLWPFFPAGGERVLFFLLPSALLLTAWVLDKFWAASWVMRLVARATLFLLLIGAGAGIIAFYTVPRYGDDDYRPLIRQVVQQGTDADGVLAVFPWQVGFWRAYAPDDLGPWPHLLSFDAVAWGPEVTQTLDESLAAGVVWIPSLLSIGSTLPQEMESYLAPRVLNLENRWISPTTRLSAWSRLRPATPQPLSADFAPVRLLSAALTPSQLPSANTPLQIDLNWEPDAQLSEFQAILRLADATGHTWAERTLPNLDALSPGSGQDRLGLLIPAGLPPGDYAVQIGVMPATANAETWPLAFVDLGTVRITPPAQPVNALRLPIHHPLAAPAPHGDALLLGYAGSDPATPVLAGTDLDLTLFWQQRGLQQPAAIYASLLDDDGGGVAGYEGWPVQWQQDGAHLPWMPGQLAQTPLALTLPGSLASGDYRLVAGLRLADGTKTSWTLLGRVNVVRRVGHFEATTPQIVLDPPVQFGTHIVLRGYDLAVDPADKRIGLTLHWQVLQPLLPPHQAFVHVDNASGVQVAQADWSPTDLGTPAPSGSWQPGEFLLDERVISVPATGPLTLRLGLYDPRTGVRLPVVQGDQGLGDSLSLLVSVP